MKSFFIDQFYVTITDYDICIIENITYNIFYSKLNSSIDKINVIKYNPSFIEIDNSIMLKRYYPGTYTDEEEVDILYTVHKCLINLLKEKDLE